MPEADQDGVQRLAWKGGDGWPQGGGQGTEPRRAPRIAIGKVANERMATLGHVDPDLMGAAGCKAALDECRRVLEATQHPVARHRRLAAIPQHRHLLAVCRAAPD